MPTTAIPETTIRRARTMPCSAVCTSSRRSSTGDRGDLVVPQRGEVRSGAAALSGHVEHAPDRPDGVDVAWLLPLVSRREEKLGGPRVAETVAVADEHVQ